MQSLEAACEEGERSIKRFKSSRSSLPLLRPQEPSTSPLTSPEILGNPPPKPTIDIFAKLLELHEESVRELTENSEGVRYKSLLLEKLIARERLNTLIVNLYPGNKGYSLAFRTVSRTDPNYTEDTANMIETKQWPYEEDDLLRYIDNEELPPFIIDLLEPQFSYLFYHGCIIAEVRDYRQTYPHFQCDIHHVLLRPTHKSLLADINNIVEEKPDWSNEEKDQLESQILMANEPTLCLDPDNSICEQVAEINNRRHMWNTHKFRRMARKFSQVTVNRKRKLDQFTDRPGLELYDFICRTKTKPKMGLSQNLTSKLNKTHEELKPVVVPNLDSPLLSPPSQGVVIKEFKSYKSPKETSDCSPQFIEEYVLETDMPSKEKGKSRIYHIKLSIFQRPSNSEYLGELYLDRDHKKDEQNGVACRFSLGSRANANRYIHQFTEIFTESGRKSVRIRYGLSPGYIEQVAIAQAQAQKVQTQTTTQANLAQQHLNQLSHSLQSQSCSTPIVNGASVGPQTQTVQSATAVPILQSQLQSATQAKATSQPISNQELEINALATKLMNSAQQFQAAANAKQQQQQQQQKLVSNAAIINLLNSSPASNINNDASAAVVNAINSSSLLPHQIQTINQKILARKMTIPSMANARVLNHSNLITLNTQLSQQQPQTITLTSVNSGNYTNFTTVPIKQHQRILSNSSSDSNKSAVLSALLVGTPAADRPDIVGANTNSLLSEKLGSASSSTSQGTTHFIQNPKSGQSFMVQSPKANTVLSPLSSPPPQSANTINVQSLNFAQLQSIQGLSNLQVQLPGFAQPISLNVSSTGNLQGHPTSLIVTLPVTTATQTSNTITQAAVNTSVAGVNNIGVGAQTVVLANAGTSNLAQLVTSGMKALPQQGIRTSTSVPQTVSIAQGGQPFQLITPLQRQRTQQTSGAQQNLTSRTLQRTPITIKMAAPNANVSQVSLPSSSAIASQLQKQAQLQHYQQICLNQPSILGKIRRRSNTSEPQ